MVLFVNRVTHREGRRAVSSPRATEAYPLVHRKEHNAEETALRHSNATVFTNRATKWKSLFTRSAPDCEQPQFMNIQRLILRDFRNLHACDLELTEGVHILCGENGQGKTNLLESIYILSNLSSFRSAHLKDLILYGATYGRILGRIRSGGVQKELMVFIREGGKIVKVNGHAVGRGVDYFGEFAALLFSPDSLKWVQGGPEFRRRFMDTAISRIDRNYLLQLKEYKRVLYQRNRLLRLIHESKAPRETLKAWNEQLVQTGSRILEKRLDYLRDLAPVLREVFKAFFQKAAEIRIQYHSSWFRIPKLNGAMADLSVWTGRFRQGIEQKEDEEVRQRTGLIGPHLDDLDFLVDGRPLKPGSSRGEMRMFAISLTLSEAKLYRNKKRRFPVLLLDDVTSELDRKRQEILCKQIESLGQVFLTTTDDSFVGKMKSCARIFQVQKGEIILVT